jgi:hypothetical protein
LQPPTILSASPTWKFASHSPTNPDSKSWHVDFRAQSISDAVAISTVANLDGLIRLFMAIENLAVELLKEGYFIRGALVRGKLYHDDRMVFGEALIRAYELENTIVRFPRVIVVRDVMQDIEEGCSGFFTDRKSDFERHLEQADDGPSLRARPESYLSDHCKTPTRKSQSPAGKTAFT